MTKCKCIMVQGTMSGAGKSLMVTALCRIFKQDGYRVAPFKSQNMALNSYITPDGLEIGRAQAAQAEAAGKDADVRMNPVLLKPCGDSTSQVIVNGRVRANLRAAEYYKMNEQLIPDVLAAFNSLAAENDIIVIEGAGSPAEINLPPDKFVNMGLADLVNAPVLLVGNIEPGGVFAQLYGTIALLTEEHRRRVIGTVINNFRGDEGLLAPGYAQLEALCGKPVLGVVPHSAADIDDEDSLSSRLGQTSHNQPLDVAIIRLPHISNFTDFSPLDEHPALGVRYVHNVDELGSPDLVILPGTKSTMDDLKWLKTCGLAAKICPLAAADVPVIGVCGGYQMLGQTISDPVGAEGGGEMPGLGLLPVETEFSAQKSRTRVGATATCAAFAGARLDAYEIHMGRSRITDDSATPFATIDGGTPDGAVKGRVFGTYLHGLFDTGELTCRLADMLLADKGITMEQFTVESREKYRNRQYDLLADTVRAHLNMAEIYRILENWQ